jgi:hypothetical protein
MPGRVLNGPSRGPRLRTSRFASPLPPFSTGILEMRIVLIGFTSCLVLTVCLAVIAQLRGGADTESGPASIVPADWYPIVSKEGGVACRFPSKPDAELRDQGEAYDWDSPFGEYLQMSWTKLPEPIDPYDDEQVGILFGECQKAFSGKTESDPLVSSNDFQFAPGVPARNVVFRGPRSRLLRMCMMLMNGRIHVLSAVGNQEFIEGDEAEAFFQSFRFLEEKPSGDWKVALWPYRF